MRGTSGGSVRRAGMTRVLLTSDPSSLSILGCTARAGHEGVGGRRWVFQCPEEALAEVGRVTNQINADVTRPSSFECIKMISMHRARLVTGQAELRAAWTPRSRKVMHIGWSCRNVLTARTSISMTTQLKD